MRTAIDTNILSVLWSAGPSAPLIAANLASAHAQGALVVSAPVFVELSALPTMSLQGEVLSIGTLLDEMNIVIDFDLGEDVWRAAAKGFAAYAIRRRNSGGGAPKRLLADFVIAAHALLRADRLMTRDLNLYAADFPKLQMI